MLVVPATPRSLGAVASESAGASSAITMPSYSSSDRAVTLSRSLGVGRGLATTDAAPSAAPTAPAPQPTAATPPTPTVDDARSFALTQIGAEQFSCLDALWQHESDWDPTAENPTSGAYGIAQALPAAKMASVADDWMSNPVTQVAWGLDYISGRYGSACNAWSFWLRHYPHWY